MSARANQLVEAGLWLQMSGDLDGARRLFEQALKLDPDSIRARELLGQSVGEAEAMPEELRDVPITRSDLFSVPLPRLFQDEPAAPASVPEDWWNAPPSDAMGNTSRFFVRGPEAAGRNTVAPTHTIPWGPSPLPPPPAPAPAAEEEFQGDDLGKSGEDFGMEFSEAGEARPEPRPTGAVPLPGLVSAEPGEGSLPSRTTGAIPLPPLVTPAPAPARGTPSPALAPPMAPPSSPRAEPSRSSGPVPLPSGASPVQVSPAPAPARPRPIPPPANAGAVPLPGGRQAPAVPEPSPAQEPVPWPMPAGPLTTPGKGLGPVPLPARGDSILSEPRTPAPPLRAEPPVASFAAVPSVPARAVTVPSDAWGGEGDGPTMLAAEGPAEALDLLVEPRTVTGLTPMPAPRDPRSEAVRLFERSRELQKMDDHSGVRELLLQAQALYPELSGLSEALARSEAKLQTIYESKIGRLNAVPRVRLKEDEVIWLNLDHRAGFMLAQIDGTLCFEDLFSVSGMSRLDTARILVQLLDQRVIVS